MKAFLAWVVLLVWVLGGVLSGCRQASDSPQEAQARLTAVPAWVLSEVYVNDALTYREGKAIENFGEVSFSRYMEKVTFRPDGVLEGTFPEAPEPVLLSWRIDAAAQAIVVGAADTTASGGTWTIPAASVYADAFEMKTQSTAFDYPRVTRILLKFKQK
jgi:hypothetical protein